MMAGEGGKYVSLTDKTARTGKPKFLMLTHDEADRFVEQSGGNFDLLVWMLVLNAQRILKRSEFDFTPRWRGELRLSTRRVYRSLQRLRKAGLLEVTNRRGKSPIVCVLGEKTG
ncbi:hypothetical protein CKO51_13235 [Rhodopirellula sp. SM50]|nr:hypothetical protein CKO51_13235 [Rhodopirellula sp. SM50]